VQSTPVVHWDKHALRLNAHHCVGKQHARNYFTQSHRYMEFGRRYTVTHIAFDAPPREYPHIPNIFRNYNHRPTFCCR